MEADRKEITHKWYEGNIQVLRELGMYAIKTLVTLNSGAFVVLLTFLGNASAQTRFTVELESIKTAMYLFLAGISASAIVVASGYINSMLMSPYDPDAGLGTRASLALYVGFSVLSFAAFVVGVLIVIGGVVET